ncbi:hypothetical protein W02_16340 [Nitrospira sp. KM1]|uniref:c-type cytochrome n=1 Tax=Nitrospira sp. KM1 TaxID=1936990 RepID=UPI0013A73B66|nr:c-type cytochrome [Nitrospira sp. KM1]BCA54494.1 hypothetical protein W02_16340 [Nitrospira sp. KM1]
MSERGVTVLIIAAIAIGFLWAFLSMKNGWLVDMPVGPVPTALLPELIPLVSGDEPIGEMFVRAGCVVCHTIPGVEAAIGRVGPPLMLGTTAVQRLNDPAYRGRAKTPHDYIVESVVDPGAYVVAGYPANTMPVWYGEKLSALALERIASYLEKQKSN